MPGKVASPRSGTNQTNGSFLRLRPETRHSAFGQTLPKAARRLRAHPSRSTQNQCLPEADVHLGVAIRLIRLGWWNADIPGAVGDYNVAPTDTDSTRWDLPKCRRPLQSNLITKFVQLRLRLVAHAPL